MYYTDPIISIMIFAVIGTGLFAESMDAFQPAVANLHAAVHGIEVVL